MKRFLTTIIVFALACTATVPVHAPKQSPEAELKSVLGEYVAGFLQRNPVVNTYLGGAGLDPSLADADTRLRDHSANAIASEDAWLKSIAARLDAIDTTAQPANLRIDRDVAKAQIAFLLHQHEVRRYQERAVDTYTEEPFRAIDWQLQAMTQTGPTTYGTADEWIALIQRVEDIPRYFRTAQDQLMAGVRSNNTADFRMLSRNGVRTAAEDAKYFESALPQIAKERMSGDHRSHLLARLQNVSAEAARACNDFSSFVADTFFVDGDVAKGVKPQFAGDRFVAGEEEYDWALKNNLRVDATAAQLYEASWPIVEARQRQMFDLARQIGKTHGWKLPDDGYAAVRAVFDQLSKDYPKNDAQMIEWYRDTAFRLVDYSRKTGLFDVPADYKLEVVEAPPPLASSMDGAAYYPAPPFRKGGVGHFYVAPTRNDTALLQMNNRSALADLSAHEGFPGHDWYYKILEMYPSDASPVRWLTPGAVEDSSSMWEDSEAAEGWALYSEDLMAEPQPDAPDGFYTPEERLYELQGQILRDVRVRIDPGMHTKRMSYDDAVDLYSQIVDFLPGSCRNPQSEAKRGSCTMAEGAIFRYSKWPTQAITYRLGKDEIVRLREEAAKKLGPSFSPKKFHLQFILQGTIPVGYFKGQLLDEVK